MKQFFYLLTFFCLLLTSVAQAATVYARQDGDWDATATWSTIGVGGATCSCTPGLLDSVVINGYYVDVDAADETVATVYLTNDRDDDARLRVENGYHLTVTGNLWAIAEDENQNVDVHIRDNSSHLEVQGNVYFERVATNGETERLQLDMEDDSDFDIDNDFYFNYYDMYSKTTCKICSPKPKYDLQHPTVSFLPLELEEQEVSLVFHLVASQRVPLVVS